MSQTEPINHSEIEHDAPYDTALKASMVDISYEEATFVINAAIEKCRQLDIACCLCVTDTHGFTVAFARMDGARHMIENTSRGRAKIAGYWGLPSRRLGTTDRSPQFSQIDINDFENLRAGISAEVIVRGPSQGGMPLFRNGEIIGGIGCAGGHGAGSLGLPDDEVARHAARAFQAWIGSKGLWD